MLTKDHVDTLRRIAAIAGPNISYAELCNIASIIENTVNIDAADDAKRQALQEIGNGCASALAEMVAALECDYDRLEELREIPAGEMDDDQIGELRELGSAAGDCESQDDARERIQEDPLSIDLTGTWTLGDTPVADRALILLGTGGPATRIVCELDEHMEPHRAWIEAQDWGTPWTEYRGDAISSDDLLAYCRCFYFGEG